MPDCNKNQTSQSAWDRFLTRSIETKQSKYAVLKALVNWYELSRKNRYSILTVKISVIDETIHTELNTL